MSVLEDLGLGFKGAGARARAREHTHTCTQVIGMASPYSPHPHRPFSRGANNRFARMLVVVMPGSLFLTWMWKQHEMLAPRETDEWPEEPDAVSIRRVVYRAPPEPQCDGEERAAMRRLGWWNSSTQLPGNCCRWRGVKCTAGRVTGLSS